MQTQTRIALKEGVLYIADNGRLICSCCAGASAKYTGRDISGQRVARMTKSHAYEWVTMFDQPPQCEGGCTTYTFQP